MTEKYEGSSAGDDERHEYETVANEKQTDPKDINVGKNERNNYQRALNERIDNERNIEVNRNGNNINEFKNNPKQNIIRADALNERPEYNLFKIYSEEEQQLIGCIPWMGKPRENPDHVEATRPVKELPEASYNAEFKNRRNGFPFKQSFYREKRENERCYECGQSGHMGVRCPNRGRKMCYRCGKIGSHLARACRGRRAIRQEQERESNNNNNANRDRVNNRDRRDRNSRPSNSRFQPYPQNDRSFNRRTAHWTEREDAPAANQRHNNDSNQNQTNAN